MTMLLVERCKWMKKERMIQDNKGKMGKMHVYHLQSKASLMGCIEAVTRCQVTSDTEVT